MNLKRVLLAGIVGTGVMTMLMLVAPLMGMPKMAIGEMLGSFLRIGTVAGWAMHFMIGVSLALIYAAPVRPELVPGLGLRSNAAR